MAAFLAVGEKSVGTSILFMVILFSRLKLKKVNSLKNDKSHAELKLINKGAISSCAFILIITSLINQCFQ